MWTIKEELEVDGSEIRLFASGGSCYARVTLRVTPDPVESQLRYESLLPVNDERQEWVPFVEEGVLEFVRIRAEQGKSIGRLKVSLVGLIDHPVDSKGWAYRLAAIKAMKQAFEWGGVEVSEEGRLD